VDAFILQLYLKVILVILVDTKDIWTI